MTLKTILLFALFSMINLVAQDYFPKNKEYNGNYYAIKSKPIKERSGNQGNFIAYNSKMISGEKSLVLSICKKCKPTIYSYSEKVSSKLQKAVFRNEISKKMVIQYDKETIFITSSTKDGKNTVDYYCKNKVKANAMTKEKADKLWLEIFSNN